MKKLVGLIAIAGLTFTLAGCAGQGAEAACKAREEKFSDFLTDILNNDPAADLKYSNALTELAAAAPEEIKMAFLETAQDVRNSNAASEACADYTKK